MRSRRRNGCRTNKDRVVWVNLITVECRYRLSPALEPRHVQYASMDYNPTTLSVELAPAEVASRNDISPV
uniref:Uncharacterized protein n=1 Tax=Physcomitrium patens TaxID=3218 RepID=A0A2K1KPF0_PHYPA|nr:hypothetical protein PHYPA_006523 [Physcomitrium patens]